MTQLATAYVTLKIDEGTVSQQLNETQRKLSSSVAKIQTKLARDLGSLNAGISKIIAPFEVLLKSLTVAFTGLAIKGIAAFLKTGSAAALEFKSNMDSVNSSFAKFGENVSKAEVFGKNMSGWMQSFGKGLASIPTDLITGIAEFLLVAGGVRLAVVGLQKALGVIQGIAKIGTTGLAAKGMARVGTVFNVSKYLMPALNSGPIAQGLQKFMFVLRGLLSLMNPWIVGIVMVTTIIVSVMLIIKKLSSTESTVKLTNVFKTLKESLLSVHDRIAELATNLEGIVESIGKAEFTRNLAQTPVEMRKLLNVLNDGVVSANENIAEAQKQIEKSNELMSITRQIANSKGINPDDKSTEYGKVIEDAKKNITDAEKQIKDNEALKNTVNEKRKAIANQTFAMIDKEKQFRDQLTKLEEQRQKLSTKAEAKKISGSTVGAEELRAQAQQAIVDGIQEQLDRDAERIEREKEILELNKETKKLQDDQLQEQSRQTNTMQEMLKIFIGWGLNPATEAV